MCGTTVTGYSSNASIIAITGIASRAAFAAAGIFLVLFGLVGKLSAMIASIPEPVIGGVFGVLCAVIAMNGFRVVKTAPLTERSMLVIGLSIPMALFATLVPQDFVKTLLDTIQYVLGSSIAFCAIWAIVLHQLLPEAAQRLDTSGPRAFHARGSEDEVKSSDHRLLAPAPTDKPK